MQSSPVSVLTRFEDKPALLSMTVVRLWSRFDVVAHVRDLGRVGLIIIYNDDVRGGEGLKTRLCAAARQPKQGCAVRQMPIDMWECGYGSELTRRGGGDHGQRQKRVWGAKH